MSDFFQTGVVATFHRFPAFRLEALEEELRSHAPGNPMALILPSLYSELAGPALGPIVEQLRHADYLAEVVVTLGPCTRIEFDKARAFFAALPQRTTLIWNNGPGMGHLFRAIQAAGLPIGAQGKGQQVWMALGYALGRGDLHGVALHDCDILTYERGIPARLCYPVMNPNLGYSFCKGYYSRVSSRLQGRVTRLLVTPLIRALVKMVGYHPLLAFFDSFRYPLAGEFALDLDLGRILRIPGDWGLEVGVLSEVQRNTSLRRVCQVDIAENYDHKHQILSPEDAEKGLNKMCIDICKSLFRSLASDGIVFSEGFFRTLTATYVRTAQDMLKRFEDDAAVNGVLFDRHEESLAVETFTGGLQKAAAIIMEDPLGVPLIASWDRVTAAIPGILDQIRDAVAADNP